MPEYAINKFSLATAGSMDISQLAGVFRFIRATTAGGGDDLAAEIEVALGAQTDDFIPLIPGQGIFAQARKWKIKWAAQAGVTATIFLSASREHADLDATQIASLVAAPLATTPTQTAVTVGTSEVSLIAANSTRQAVTFLNNGTVDIFIGKTGVTTVNGFKVAAGQSYTTTTCTGQFFGISGTAAQNVRVLEEHS